MPELFCMAALVIQMVRVGENLDPGFLVGPLLLLLSRLGHPPELRPYGAT